MTDLFCNDEEGEPLYNVPGYENRVNFCLHDYLKGNYKMHNDIPIKCFFEIKDCSPKRISYYISTIWDELGNNYLKMERTVTGAISFTAMLPPKGAILFTQQFGDFVRLLAPAELCDQMRKLSEDFWKDYHNKNK